MIPQEKTTAVARAVVEAFGTSQIDDVQKMTRVLSPDLVFRIVVRGSPYSLRIMTRMDEINDPFRVFTCMKTAADGGLAPRVHYASAEDGIAITDWIDAVHFPLDEARVRLPATLRRLHALAPFPKAFNYVTAHRFFIWRLRAAGLLPTAETEPVFRRYAQVCAAYPQLDEDVVSCHMDFKPEKMLFDGEQVWLIDWRAAHRNDRYFDLSVVANFVIENEADELAYLEQYFGHPPSAHQLARFFLMRQALHLLSAAVFLLLGSGGKPIPQAADLPSFRDFHQRIWAGEIDLGDNEMKVVCGRVHWAKLCENTRNPRFDEALKTVAETNQRLPNLRLLFPSAA